MEKMDREVLKKKLNKLLPDDIYIKKVLEVNQNFHARYDCIAKEYIYKINLGEYNPLDAQYIYQYNQPLNIEAMKNGIQKFLGRHDFTSFTKAKKEDSIRNISEVNLSYEGELLTISFKGDGFMQYMVRIMVGFLIEIGENKRRPDEVKEVLNAKDRRKAGITAPPQGLYLNKVIYEDVIL
jgi:tRNA pseudouridine38-40 synthase